MQTDRTNLGTLARQGRSTTERDLVATDDALRGTSPGPDTAHRAGSEPDRRAAERPDAARSTADRATTTGRRLKALTALADATATAVALALALTVYGGFFDRSVVEGVSVAALSIPVWLAVFAQQGLYQARHLTRRIEEIRRLVNGVLMGMVGLAGISVVLQVSLSRGWIALVGVLVFVCVAVEREGVRAVIRRLRSSGQLVRSVLLVGNNAEADELIEMLQSSRELGYRVVGRVHDGSVGDDGPASSQVPDLGTTDDILSIVDESGASSVVVATTSISLETANRLVRDLTREGIYVELSSSMRDIATRRVTLRPLGRYPVMSVEPVSANGWRSLFKRAFDIVVAGVAIVLVAPVLALSAVAIRVTSGPGVFFRQVRVGRNGTPFTVLKFRTMVHGAESMLPDLLDANEADGPMFKMANDPRVTAAGRFLRRTSIDELPQLFNVLAGHMSLVGPRPALPHEAVQWNDDLRERLRVKPGITGNWQVNGRFTASIEDYQRLDLYYVDNWSIVTDLVILAKTIPAVLRRNGAA